MALWDFSVAIYFATCSGLDLAEEWLTMPVCGGSAPVKPTGKPKARQSTNDLSANKCYDRLHSDMLRPLGTLQRAPL